MYSGPDPKSINPDFEDHTEDYVVCLADGTRHEEITVKYLRSIGWTRGRYKRTFPDAPLKSKTKLNSKYYMDDATRQQRRERMLKMNSDPYYINKKIATRQSKPKSAAVTKRKSAAAKWQWKHDRANMLKGMRERYTTETWQNSEERKDRSERMKVLRKPRRHSATIKILSENLGIDTEGATKAPKIKINGKTWSGDIMIGNKIYYIGNKNDQTLQEILLDRIRQEECRKLGFELIKILLKKD